MRVVGKDFKISIINIWKGLKAKCEIMRETEYIEKNH